MPRLICRFCEYLDKEECPWFVAFKKRKELDDEACQWFVSLFNVSEYQERMKKKKEYPKQKRSLEF